MISQIILDCDNVLVDTDYAISRVFGVSVESLDSWWYHECLGLTIEQVWDRVGHEGPGFWANLEQLQGAFALHTLCLSKVPTVIVTSLPDYPDIQEHIITNAIIGKVQWFKKNFPLTRYFIGQPKEFFAGEYTVLIDDSEENCRKFAARGGKTILYPHRGNTNRLITNKLEYVKQMLREYEVS